MFPALATAIRESGRLPSGWGVTVIRGMDSSRRGISRAGMKHPGPLGF